MIILAFFGSKLFVTFALGFELLPFTAFWNFSIKFLIQMFGSLKEASFPAEETLKSLASFEESKEKTSSTAEFAAENPFFVLGFVGVV